MKKDAKETLKFIRQRVKRVRDIKIIETTKHHQIHFFIDGLKKPIKMTVACTASDWRSRHATVCQLNLAIRKELSNAT